MCEEEVAVTPEGSTRSGLRERRRRSTRDEISAAALDLFESQGVEATTLEQIARAADVSARTVLRHFPTKEDAALLIHQDFADALEARLARDSGHPPMALLALVYSDVLGTYGTGDGPAARQMLRVCQLMTVSPALHTAGLRLDAEQSKRLVERIAKITGTDPELDLEPRLAVEITTAAVRVALEVWVTRIRRGNPVDARELFTQALRIIHAPPPGE
ncbi:TetR/AcrR family transcriptional regulator [Streptomyces corynorhini]|nr:TetR/AcrR family transcriptional regulator [Streptomyces corynorhini]